MIRIDKTGEEIIKTISYRLQFIDSAKFTASSLSNLVNNLAEGIQKIKCKYGHNHDINKIILLLQKGVYPCEYMDDWKHSMKFHCLKKKIFTVTQTWKILLMMQITCTQRVCKDFKIRNLGYDHDLYVQSDTILLADVFQNF